MITHGWADDERARSTCAAVRQLSCRLSVGGDKETTTAAAAAASSDLVLYGGERGERRKIEGGGKKWVVDWVIGGEREGRKEGGSEPDGFHCHFGVLDKVTRRPKLVR